MCHAMAMALDGTSSNNIMFYTYDVYYIQYLTSLWKREWYKETLLRKHFPFPFVTLLRMINHSTFHTIIERNLGKHLPGKLMFNPSVLFSLKAHYLDLFKWPSWLIESLLCGLYHGLTTCQVTFSEYF